jgi:hypothetical protein
MKKTKKQKRYSVFSIINIEGENKVVYVNVNNYIYRRNLSIHGYISINSGISVKNPNKLKEELKKIKKINLGGLTIDKFIIIDITKKKQKLPIKFFSIRGDFFKFQQFSKVERRREKLKKLFV